MQGNRQQHERAHSYQIQSRTVKTNTLIKINAPPPLLPPVTAVKEQQEQQVATLTQQGRTKAPQQNMIMENTKT